MFALISLPSASDVIASSTTWTTAWLPEFWILVGFAVGVMVVGLVVKYVIKTLKGGVRSAFGGRRGRRGRRR